MTIIYSRTISRTDVPENHPTLTTFIRLSEEATGFLLFEETYLDGDCPGPQLVKWTFGMTTSDRADAIEHAVAYVQQRCRAYNVAEAA